jgi:hypothetical protein
MFFSTSEVVNIFFAKIFPVASEVATISSLRFFQLQVRVIFFLLQLRCFFFCK